MFNKCINKASNSKSIHVRNSNKLKKAAYFKIISLCLLVIFLISTSTFVFASSAEEQQATSATSTEVNDSAETVSDSTSVKALAAALTIGVGAAAAAIAMGISISKSLESIARQPEAAGKIRANLILGLVFVETAVIYALVVAIMIIFVL